MRNDDGLTHREARQVMKRFFVTALTTAVIGIGLLPMPASATLHGFCAGAGQCVDNGTNSPTTNNPPQNFGFVSSPAGETGQFRIDILVPNNLAAVPPGSVSFGITGNNASSVTGTATLFNTTAFTSGFLATYLGISASPANPIGAYLPATQALDPGATGFFVYQASFASVPALNGNMSETLSGSLPIGSYIVAFVLDAPGTDTPWQATANSGAIFETSPPRVPEPTTLLLIGTGLVAVGAGAWRRRQR